MRRTVYDTDHEAFGKSVRAIIEAEVVPVHDRWFEAGIAAREFYCKPGEFGVWGIEVPEEYGGGQGMALVLERLH
jgi:alkylation response protein AidB-like acyl-CoA dehydrogenase